MPYNAQHIRTLEHGERTAKIEHTVHISGGTGEVRDAYYSVTGTDSLNTRMVYLPPTIETYARALAVARAFVNGKD